MYIPKKYIKALKSYCCKLGGIKNCKECGANIDDCKKYLEEIYKNIDKEINEDYRPYVKLFINKMKQIDKAQEKNLH